MTPALTHLDGRGMNLLASVILAEAAAASYGQQPAVAAWARAAGFSDCSFIAHAEAEGFVASTATAVCVAFRGTQSITDWIRNLQIVPTSHPGGHVHLGFSTALDQIWTRISDELARQGGAQKFVWITGHSLGGAMATLAGMRLHEADRKVTGFHTFGQPKVAKADFVANFNAAFGQQCWRFVNGGDLVTRIPPNLSHVGVPRHITGSGDLEAEGGGTAVETADLPAMSEIEFAALQAELNREAESVLATEGLIPWVRDHAMTEYLGHLRRLAGTP